MNVIDMRCRPAYLHDFFGATPGTGHNRAPVAPSCGAHPTAPRS